MDIDIHIYVKRLKAFFDRDKEARKDMFGSAEISMKQFYIMVTEQATANSKKEGNPMLSSNQILEIVTDLALEEIKQEITIPHIIKRQQEIDKLFVHLKDGFPPICLN